MVSHPAAACRLVQGHGSGAGGTAGIRHPAAGPERGGEIRDLSCFHTGRGRCGDTSPCGGTDRGSPRGRGGGGKGGPGPFQNRLPRFGNGVADGEGEREQCQGRSRHRRNRRGALPSGGGGRNRQRGAPAHLRECPPDSRRRLGAGRSRTEERRGGGGLGDGHQSRGRRGRPHPLPYRLAGRCLARADHRCGHGGRVRLLLTQRKEVAALPRQATGQLAAGKAGTTAARHVAACRRQRVCRTGQGGDRDGDGGRGYRLCHVPCPFPQSLREAAQRCQRQHRDTRTDGGRAGHPADRHRLDTGQGRRVQGTGGQRFPAEHPRGSHRRRPLPGVVGTGGGRPYRDGGRTLPRRGTANQDTRT